MTIPRNASVERTTGETSVSVRLSLDGPLGPADSQRPAGAAASVDVECGFLGHMLELFAFHSRFGLAVTGRGDTRVDCHHLTEDIGLCLGEALHRALGDKRGVARYGHAAIPMDEALCMVTVDLSGRPYLVYNAVLPVQQVGGFDTELIEEFMRAVASAAGIALHVNVMYGRNTHHIIEAMFKAMGRAFAAAAAVTSADIPSSKGVL